MLRRADAATNRVAITGHLNERQVAVLRTGRHLGSLASHLEERRRRGLVDVRAAARAAAADQDHVAAAMRDVGAIILEHDLATGSVTALLPAQSLAAVGALPNVRSVELVHVEADLSLQLSTAAIGAPAMWDAGHLGGRGASDTYPVDLAILHDKIEQEHPAFAGIHFQRPSDAPIGTSCGQRVSGCEHGTEVASMAISRGAAGCAACVSSDSSRMGVAPRLDSVLDAQASGMADDTAWALGVGSFGIQGATDPAEVMSNSHGSVAEADDSGSLRRTDKLISAYGALIAYPAGNEGPARTVNANCIAYDTLCVGGFDHRGTVDPADDVVEDFSSRGPTPGGRKKPDLVAVSTSEFANQHWIRDGRLWSGGSGTSLAAPQGAGAAALLAGSGIAAPIAQKAILINSARQGRATPTSPMGTQAGWQPDWGWGALDLDAAVKERTHFYMDDVAGGDAHFYRADVQAAGDRATLVWNRRALGCIDPGCDTTTLTLSNLELEQLDPATGAVEARSASGIDNVEQVRSPATGPVIYKVKASSTVDGLPGEPYALASRRQITPLAAPRPRARVTLSTTVARPGEPVTVMAELSNPSPDLSAESASATIALPPGVAIDEGSATQPVGTLAPGASTVVSWTVRASGDAVNRIAVRSTASRYGETFGSEDQATFTSDGSPPSVAIAVPARGVTDPAIPIAWSGTDAGAGLRDYTVEVATNDGAFSPWLTATSATAATYTGTPGARYRFRVRATDRLGTTSGYATTDEVVVEAPRAEPQPVPRPPGPAIRTNPRLRVRSIARRGSRIELRGTIASDAFRRLTVELNAKSGTKRVRRNGAAFPQAGRFKLALRAPQRLRGTLSLRYTGDERYEPATTLVKLRGL